MLAAETINVEKSYGVRKVVRNVNLKIYEDSRIGIVGRNGSGKSTLLQLIAGVDEPDKGHVNLWWPPAFIPQLEKAEPLFLTAKEKDIWGVSGMDEPKKSGGEETRKKIAEAFSAETRLLLADEPTSHLDIEGIEQLEKSLKRYQGGIVLISHDEMLLNNICTVIWEIEDGVVTEYAGNYSAYQNQKQQENERKAKEYESYHKEKKRLEAAAEAKEQHARQLKKAPSRMGNSEARLHKRSVGRQKAKLSRAGKSVEKRMTQLEEKEKPFVQSQLSFKQQPFTPLYGKSAVFLDEGRITRNGRLLFQMKQTDVVPGTKLAVTGSNGCGKTTLLEKIYQQEEGIITAKPAVIGYFDQTVSRLNLQKSVLENVKESSLYTEPFIRTVLAGLQFKKEKVHQPMFSFSGGERVKAALLKVMMEPANLLLLDEPTNYLDMEAKEALKGLIQTYPGTIIFVTHDREFTADTATHVMEIESGKAEISRIADLEQPSGEERNERITLLEMKITEVLSRLGEAEGEEKIKLEQEFQELIKQKNIQGEQH
ncbi:ribosomal protection-like ABC-F family protein [Sinobaca sp. H24]|uniref:ribosomal protection-like ABC-F family protein n=1 Tax=Sinobaca sp. H24 TaxID=2923376 RepID=UPI00207A255E|nr:ABC-F type ribosomal protection protein [Sinobaca sp. H24]